VKYVKMLGLAALAALATMAFIGATTASADTLCKSLLDPCPEAERYAIGTEIVGLTLTGVPALLLVEEGGKKVIKEECHSKTKGKTTENLGAHTGLAGLIEELSFTNCKGLCPKAKGETPFKLEGFGLQQHILVTKHSGVGLQPSAILEECTIFKVKCLYEVIGESALLTIRSEGGATQLELHAEEIPLLLSEGSSGLCPYHKGWWDALYLIETPNPAHLVALP
jgi:hypothetical protein